MSDAMVNRTAWLASGWWRPQLALGRRVAHWRVAHWRVATSCVAAAIALALPNRFDTAAPIAAGQAALAQTATQPAPPSAAATESPIALPAAVLAAEQARIDAVAKASR